MEKLYPVTYLFYGVLYVDVLDCKVQDDQKYYFIRPRCVAEGWWLTSENFLKLYDILTYVEPYNPVLPRKYISKFIFNK